MAVSNSSPLRNLNNALKDVDKSNERLASGKRINKAADDAAGLAIALALATDTVTLQAASRNIDYGTSLNSIADAAAGQVSEIGTRMAELATQASNGVLSDEQRGALQEEYSQLAQEAQRIVESTEFNGTKVFSSETITFQVGTGSDANSQIALKGTNLASIVSGVASADIATQEGAKAALDAVKGFVADISSKRGEIGAVQSRLDTAQANISSSVENTQAARSRIEDVDFADEIAKRTAASIRSDAATAAFAHGNLSASIVTRLLQ